MTKFQVTNKIPCHRKMIMLKGTGSVTFQSSVWRTFSNVLYSLPQPMYSKLSPQVNSWYAIMHGIALPTVVEFGAITVATQYFTLWLPSWHTFGFTVVLTVSAFRVAILASTPKPLVKCSPQNEWSDHFFKEKNQISNFTVFSWDRKTILQNRKISKVSMKSKYWS